MEPREQSSEAGFKPQDILERMLGRQLSPDEEHMPINFHKHVEEIDVYLEQAKQYYFIEVIEPRTRYLGGWEAAVRFPEGQTITFWQERWPDELTDGKAPE